MSAVCSTLLDNKLLCKIGKKKSILLVLLSILDIDLYNMYHSRRRKLNFSPCLQLPSIMTISAKSGDLKDSRKIPFLRLSLYYFTCMIPRILFDVPQHEGNRSHWLNLHFCPSTLMETTIRCVLPGSATVPIRVGQRYRMPTKIHCQGPVYTHTYVHQRAQVTCPF